MICFYVSLSVVLVVLVVVSVLSLRVLRRLRLDVSRLGKTVEAQKKPETLGVPAIQLELFKLDREELDREMERVYGVWAYHHKLAHGASEEELAVMRRKFATGILKGLMPEEKLLPYEICAKALKLLNAVRAKYHGAPVHLECVFPPAAAACETDDVDPSSQAEPMKEDS